jgi:hypothetical protein
MAFDFKKLPKFKYIKEISDLNDFVEMQKEIWSLIQATILASGSRENALLGVQAIHGDLMKAVDAFYPTSNTTRQ